MPEDRGIARRSVQGRSAAWAVKVAVPLARAGVRPNTTSLAGVASAATGCAATVLSAWAATARRAVLSQTAIAGAVTAARRAPASAPERERR